MDEEKRDLSKIITENKFDFRIKPNIEHMNAYINRAIEELQKIIVSNDIEISLLKQKIEQLERKTASGE